MLQLYKTMIMHVCWQKYMKEAGYNDLFSEWWHFQDDETKEKMD